MKRPTRFGSRRPKNGLTVHYQSLLGVPCGSQEIRVPLGDDFFWRRDPRQDYTMTLAVPALASSLTVSVGRSDLVVERDLDE